MIVPVAYATAEIGIAVRSDVYVVVLANVTRFTNRALVCPILFFSFEDLHHMTYDRLTSMYGY